MNDVREGVKRVEIRRMNGCKRRCKESGDKENE